MQRAADMPPNSLEQQNGRSQRLGKYEVLAHVASGAMGAVYRAFDHSKGREVALKILSPDLAENPTSIRRFDREARAAARLRHENIVAVHELGKKKGAFYIAMEYVDGIDLHRYVIGKGPLKVEEALEILIQAARGLEHAHEQGIIHRDIKPSNFIITREQERRVVKLTDFGLALDRAAGDESRLTRAGTTLGTVDYMPPEQAKGGQFADARSDIYSLGCTAYFMVTGSAPFPEGSVPEKLYKHVHVHPTDPREFNPTLPDDFVTLLGKMVQKNPEDRHQSVAELSLELNALLEKYRPRVDDLLAALHRDGAKDLDTPRERPAFQHVTTDLAIAGDDSDEWLAWLHGWWVLPGLAALLATGTIIWLLYLLS